MPHRSSRSDKLRRFPKRIARHQASPIISTVDGQSVLITGGTGSFAGALIDHLLSSTEVAKVIVFSRDEFKQWEMARRLGPDERLRFFLGDVRDVDRLRRAFAGVDVVVHAAAMKQVDAAEYNPFEAVQTNILGSKNVVDAAIDRDVGRVIALSTDKACAPTNLYGATKLVSEKLFVDGNAYVGRGSTSLAVVRYGNLLDSRGSVVEVFRDAAASGELPVTDERMTRFWMTLEHSVECTMTALEQMRGGEVYVPKMPSFRVIDLATAIAPDARIRTIGVRPGEKLHEELISPHECRQARDLGSLYVIEPDFPWWHAPTRAGEQTADNFHYASDNNPDRLAPAAIAELLAQANIDTGEADTNP